MRGCEQAAGGKHADIAAVHRLGMRGGAGRWRCTVSNLGPGNSRALLGMMLCGIADIVRERLADLRTVCGEPG